MRKVTPDWLDDTAAKLWRKLYRALNISATSEDVFAVMCQTYSEYRHATDLRAQKIKLDYFLKLAKEFGMTPRSARAEKADTDQADELDTLFEMTRGSVER